jgi:hypothetical protein
MLGLIIIVAAAVLIWYLGVWPFNRSYPYLTKYSELGVKKTDVPPPPA